MTNQGGIQFTYYEWKKEAAIILVFPLGPLIHRLRVSFAFRAFSDARQGAQFSRALSRARVCGGGSQGYTHVRAHAYPCATTAAASSESRDFARAALRNKIATLSPSDTGSTLKARSQEGIETFGVTGCSRHTSLPRTRAIEEMSLELERKML